MLHMAASAGMLPILRAVLAARIDANPHLPNGRMKLLLVLVSMLCLTHCFPELTATNA